MTAETTQYQGRTWLTPPNSRYARTSITARKRNARPFLSFGRQLGIHGCVKNDRRAIPLPLVALVPQWRQNSPNNGPPAQRPWPPRAVRPAAQPLQATPSIVVASSDNGPR